MKFLSSRCLDSAEWHFINSDNVVQQVLYFILITFPDEYNKFHSDTIFVVQQVHVAPTL